MGLGSWKFSGSWASNLTAAGTILGLALAAEVLPKSNAQYHYLTKNTYVVMNLLFGVIIIVAVLLYNTVQWKRRVRKSTSQAQTTTFLKPTEIVITIADRQQSFQGAEEITVNAPQEHSKEVEEFAGFVGVFLFASAIVVWAILGQLFTTWHLLSEIPSKTVSPSIRNGSMVVVFLTEICAVFYGIVSIPWTLHNQKREMGKKDFAIM
jgi:hypothetical protein